MQPRLLKTAAKFTLLANLLLLLPLFMAFVLGGCSPARVKTQDMGEEAAGKAVTMANPASVNCVRLGGKLEIRKDGKGNEVGVCVFPDGRECEEWALFRDGKCVPGGGRSPSR